MKCSILLLGAMATALPASAATIVDISQKSFTGFYDYGDNTGQTFSMQRKGTLEGIRLYIDRSGAGANVVLNLYTLNDAQTALKNLVATSTVTAANFSNDSSWVYFALNTAFSISAGQKMAFTFSQPGSGGGGFVSYASSNANPYDGGTMVSSNFSPSPNLDIAFETHVRAIPEAVSAFIPLVGVFFASRRKRKA